MEVHHHSNVHHSKKWKDYLYEFLMLFLAVSAGFFMENVREHHVECERAEVLARSFNSDICKDTIALNEAIVYSKFKEQTLDSGINELYLPRNEWNDTLIYRALMIANRVMPFDRTKGTYAQLTASGSLRYFPQPLVNLMNEYDVQAEKVIVREELDTKFLIEQFFPFAIKNMNSEVITQLTKKIPLTKKMFFKTTDETFCHEFINHLNVTLNLRSRSNLEYSKLKSISVELLKELNKDYPGE
jgi:hypothetical protein